MEEELPTCKGLLLKARVLAVRKMPDEEVQMESFIAQSPEKGQSAGHTRSLSGGQENAAQAGSHNEGLSFGMSMMPQSQSLPWQDSLPM